MPSRFAPLSNDSALVTGSYSIDCTAHCLCSTSLLLWLFSVSALSSFPPTLYRLFLFSPRNSHRQNHISYFLRYNSVSIEKRTVDKYSFSCKIMGDLFWNPLFDAYSDTDSEQSSSYRSRCLSRNSLPSRYSSTSGTASRPYHLTTSALIMWWQSAVSDAVVWGC